MNQLKALWILVLSLSFFCQAEQKNPDENIAKRNSECPIEEFLASDTGGTFRGAVVRISEQKKDAAHRYLSLVDQVGDTIAFRVFLENTDTPTENVKEAKLKSDMCVEVHYVTDIIEEEGFELNRFYYATRLEYAREE